jgi:hypothetical protein
MSNTREQKIRQVLAGRSLLREALKPVTDDWDETFRMSDWPPGARGDDAQHQYKHRHHHEPTRFSLPMSAH